jgi:hypothetical protein
LHSWCKSTAFRVPGASKLSDYDLEGWLLEFSEREQAILSLRMAARVLPALSRDIEIGTNPEAVSDILLPHFRQLICGLSYCYFDDTPLKEALRKSIQVFAAGLSSKQTGASDAARCIRDAAASALRLRSAAGKWLAREAMDSSRRILRDGASWDSSYQETLDLYQELERLHQRSDHAATIQRPLWSDVPQSKNVAGDFIKLKLVLEQNNEDWEFFSHWFESYWRGNEVNWDFMRSVALIPDEIWKSGIAVTAHEIRILQERALSERLALAENVEIDTETGRFRVVPIAPKTPLRLDVIISRAGDALHDAVQCHNGLSENSWVTKALRRVIAVHSDDPQRVEMDFTTVSLTLRRQIESTLELPNSDENLALLHVLEEGVMSLRGLYPEIAENRRIIALQKLREISAIDKEAIRESTTILADISQGRLRQDFQLDIAAIVDDRPSGLQSSSEEPDLAKVDSAARVFTRLVKIRDALGIESVVSKIEGATSFKAAKIVTTIGGVIAIGMRILGII